jgi:hypothetical protein
MFCKIAPGRSAIQQIPQRFFMKSSVFAGGDHLLDCTKNYRRWVMGTLVAFVIGGAAQAQTIDTTTGTGQAGYSGDGSTATKAMLNPHVPSRITRLPEASVAGFELSPKILDRPLGSKITLNLDGKNETFVFDRREVAVSGNRTWIGYLEGDRSRLKRAILTFGDPEDQGGIIGRIQTESGLFKVDTYVGQNYLIDLAKAGGEVYEGMTEDAVSVARSGAAKAGARTATVADTGIAVIDAIFYYAEGVKTAYPGAALQTRLDFFIAYTNQVHVNSAIDARYRLVKAIYSNYSETNTMQDAYRYLWGSSTSADRATYGADVALLYGYFETNGVCGLGTLPERGEGDAADFTGYALSVVSG